MISPNMNLHEISRQDWLTVIIVVCCFLLAMILFKSRKKEKGIYLKHPQNNQLRKELENLVAKDKATANRLIELERKYRPQASENELISLAIERLVRERR